MSWGKDPRTWLENERNTADYVGAITGSRQLGMASAFGIEEQVARARQSHHEAAAAALGRGQYLGEFDENAVRAKLGQDQKGMMDDDKMFGNPRLTAAYILSSDNSISPDGRKSLQAALAKANSAKNMEEAGLAAAHISDAVKAATGRSIQSYASVDKLAGMRPEDRDAFAAQNAALLQTQQAEVFLANRSQAIGATLGVGTDQAAGAATLLLKTMDSGTRDNFLKGLHNKSWGEASAALAASKLTPAQQKEALAYAQAGGASPEQAAARIGALQNQFANTPGMAGWMTGEGSGDAILGQGRRTSAWFSNMAFGTENVQGMDILGQFMHGTLGGTGMVQNTQVAAVAKAMGKEAFSFAWDSKTNALKNDGNLTKSIDKMKAAGIDFEKAGYGTSDTAELAKALSADGGAGMLGDYLAKSNFSMGNLNGEIVGTNQTDAQFIESNQAAIQAAEINSRMNRRNLTPEQRKEEIDRMVAKQREAMLAGTPIDAGRNMDGALQGFINNSSDIAKSIIENGNSEGGIKDAEAFRYLISDGASRAAVEAKLDADTKKLESEGKGDSKEAQNLRDLKKRISDKDKTPDIVLLESMDANLRRLADRATGGSMYPNT
jgi:hypothetical protein